MKVIGLTGKAGAGKNYVGELMCDLGYDGTLAADGTKHCTVELASFAAVLKDTCAAMFCIDRALMDTEEGKKSLTHWRWEDVVAEHKLVYVGNPASPFHPETQIDPKKTGFISVREILQYIGTNVVRNHWNPKHWIQAAGLRMARSNAGYYVFTDCRFPNEANFIHQNNGVIWEVTGRQTAGVPEHVSEKRDFQVDGIIDNRPGTTDRQLIAQIEHLLVDEATLHA